MSVIVWFRQDLRLIDNPAYQAAVESGAPVFPVYVLDDDNAGQWRMGAASRWWLHESLAALDGSLKGNLALFRGNADEIIPRLAAQIGASGVFWNRCYEPWRIARDRKIKSQLTDAGLNVKSFNGSLLFEPHTVSKADGTPYKVFTPFYKRGCLARTPRAPQAAATGARLARTDSALDLSALELMPKIPWHETIAAEWTPGEAGAQARVDAFFDEGLCNYRAGRDRPDQNYVSRLSPHIHFGEVSVNQLWQAAGSVDPATADEQQVEHFRRELAWREFSYSLLFHWPDLPTKNLQEKFDRYPWHSDADSLAAWQRGKTGYPIVDAGMRELWQTGYMHNRVRMIVASFLVKNLGVHWHHGADWFWDTLLDADLASNSASWQWVAGSGADAAPFFRIFNPVTQGQRFDPDGVYVRRYVEEVAALPDKFVHRPWDAPPQVQKAAALRLGETYPEPIIDLKASREQALAAYRDIKT